MAQSLRDPLGDHSRYTRGRTSKKGAKHKQVSILDEFPIEKIKRRNLTISRSIHLDDP